MDGKEGKPRATVARRHYLRWLWWLGAGALAYGIGLRPWMLSWGARPDENAMALPGDEIVDNPRTMATRALTIEAPPHLVWPWLVQMGQGRGGLYSYDWLENLVGCDIHSVDHIVPELQQLQVGDRVWLMPPENPPHLGFVVRHLVPERVLVLGTPGPREEALAAGMPHFSWAFVLLPESNGRTRLVIRSRCDYQPTVLGVLANGYGLEPVQFMMERKMMLGIRARAEALAREEQSLVEETLLDELLPDYEFRGIERITIHATAEEIFAAFDALTLADMPVARWLGELRYLPVKWVKGELSASSANGAGDAHRPFKELILETGNRVVGERPGQEVVIAAIGKFHQMTDQAFVQFSGADEFKSFNDPGYQKLAQSIRIAGGDPEQGVTVLFEHRTHGLSPAAQRAFAYYWLVIKPSGNWLVRMLLRAVKRRAEAAHGLRVQVG
jgi:hypothetical protein